MRSYEYLFDFFDWLTDPPSGGTFQKWMAGAALSSVVACYGLWCCITQHATTLNVGLRGFAYTGRGFWRELNGAPAVTFGLAILCVGTFIHFQWYWGNDRRLDTYYEIGKYGAALCFVIAVISHIYTILTHT